MFPHLFTHWLTAQSARTFRYPLMLYPLCIAIVWIPSVLLGIFGSIDFPGLKGAAANSVLVKMIDLHAPGALAGLLAAGVFAAIMSSLDSQVLSISNMFTQDIVRHYRKGDELSEKAQVLSGRLFVIAIFAVTYVLSLVSARSIFALAVWSFTGFAALFPGGRRRSLLEAQHQVRRLCLRAHRGRAVVLFLLSGVENPRLYGRHDRGNARGGNPSGFCRGHDRRLAADQAASQKHGR